MDTLREKMNTARNGHGILFCGAGFSADCLNFANAEEIGVGAHLLMNFNEWLEAEGFEHGFSQLTNASEYCLEQFGQGGLMQRLQSRFAIENVTADLVDVMTYPWERVYTTNYDNAIELACARANVQAHAINNLDQIDALKNRHLNIVHLHGRANSWDQDNFTSSCILSSSSYHQTERLKHWLNFFRKDLDRAEVIVFIGFNASDFHLNDVLMDVSSLRSKTFFINMACPHEVIDPFC